MKQHVINILAAKEYLGGYGRPRGKPWSETRKTPAARRVSRKLRRVVKHAEKRISAGEIDEAMLPAQNDTVPIVHPYEPVKIDPVGDYEYNVAHKYWQVTIIDLDDYTMMNRNNQIHVSRDSAILAIQKYYKDNFNQEMDAWDVARLRSYGDVLISEESSSHSHSYDYRYRVDQIQIYE